MVTRIPGRGARARAGDVAEQRYSPHVATSYWYHRPADDFPPAPVQTPVDPPGPERLNVACTQTALAPSAARRLVADWCARLPLLRNVRTLWFSSRVSQQLFDAACSMSEL